MKGPVIYLPPAIGKVGNMYANLRSIPPNLCKAIDATIFWPSDRKWKKVEVKLKSGGKMQVFPKAGGH